MQRLTCWLVAFGIVSIPASGAMAEGQPAGGSNVVTVTAEGEGMTKEAAKSAALRNALEIGGKQEIAAFSKAKNYVLVRDTIFSRTEGIIVDYKVLSEEEGAGGTYICKIRAQVDKKAIATRWGEVQNLLEQIGQPRVMVYIKEKIDGRVQEGSILESKIEERLVKAGFSLVAKSAMEAKLKKELADAGLEDNVKRIQVLSKKFHAQVYIVGYANANFAEIADLYGVKAAMYNCDAVAKCYYTDSGVLLASESIVDKRGGARGVNTNSPQAARKGLTFAGQALIDKMYETCMRSWATQSSFGGDVELEVDGIDYKTARTIRKLLEGMTKQIRSVRMSWDKPIAQYRIKAKLNAEDLADLLCEGEWEKLIEIEDVKLNRIQAKGAAQ